MITDKFEFTIGVTEGYFHDNENANVDFLKLVEECARETEELMGTYISFCVVPSTLIYKKDWGCPDGGEKTYTVSAIRNPKFNECSTNWKTCCLNVAARLRTKLKQETVTCEFSEVSMWYLGG